MKPASAPVLAPARPGVRAQLYRFAQMEGRWHSLSGLDRRVCTLFFYWSVWTVFLARRPPPSPSCTAACLLYALPAAAWALRSRALSARQPRPHTDQRARRGAQGAMLGGSAFSQLGALIDNPASLPSLIGTALPTSSNFFINYMIIQARPRPPPCALRYSALTCTACLTYAAHQPALHAA